MNESPVLGGVHSVEDIETADDFSKKHVPYRLGSARWRLVMITVEVGTRVAQPNMPDHWIEYIAVMANGAPILTVDYAAGVVAPTFVAKAMLDPGTKVAAFEALPTCTASGSPRSRSSSGLQSMPKTASPSFEAAPLCFSVATRRPGDC